MQFDIVRSAIQFDSGFTGAASKRTTLNLDSRILFLYLYLSLLNSSTNRPQFIIMTTRHDNTSSLREVLISSIIRSMPEEPLLASRLPHPNVESTNEQPDGQKWCFCRGKVFMYPGNMGWTSSRYKNRLNGRVKIYRPCPSTCPPPLSFDGRSSRYAIFPGAYHSGT